MKRKPIPQYEFPWKDEPFRLVSEQAVDGERVTREQQQQIQDQHQADAKQNGFATMNLEALKLAQVREFMQAGYSLTYRAMGAAITKRTPNPNNKPH